MTPFTKVKKIGQKVYCCGWHKHVSPKERTRANKIVRRILKRDLES